MIDDVVYLNILSQECMLDGQELKYGWRIKIKNSAENIRFYIF